MKKRRKNNKRRGCDHDFDTHPLLLIDIQWTILSFLCTFLYQSAFLIGGYLTLLVDCTSFFLFPLVGYFFVEFFPRFLLKSFCLNPFILLELCIYSFEFFSFSFIMEFFLLYFILIPLLEFLQINFFLSVLFVCSFVEIIISHTLLYVNKFSDFFPKFFLLSDFAISGLQSNPFHFIILVDFYFTQILFREVLQ